MPPRSPLAEVNPAVFIWLRKSSGWTVPEVAKRIGTSESVIEAIENGVRNPTLRQLKVLATAYHRPLAAFFLPVPKAEKPLPKDLRLIRSTQKGIFTKKTLLAIRKARHLQAITQELLTNTKIVLTSPIELVTIDTNYRNLAREYRDRFQLTMEKQQKFTTSYKLFNYLRDILEDWGIFVFQFSMPADDARGFVLADDNPIVIVVNTRDSIEARIFTLMHEFAHLLLGKISIIDNPSYLGLHSNKIEVWCNNFAASFLLPESEARRLFALEETSLLETKTLKRLSRKLKLSQTMILYNMYKYQFITQTEYNRILNRFQVISAQESSDTGEGGGPPIDIKRLSELGVKFVSLVVTNFEKQQITYSDALGYLSIKAKNFDKVLAKATK